MTGLGFQWNMLAILERNNKAKVSNCKAESCNFGSMCKTTIIIS